MASTQQSHHEELWRRLREGQDEEARQALVESHVGLVRYVAGRLAVGLPHYLEFPDLYGAGFSQVTRNILDQFDVRYMFHFINPVIKRLPAPKTAGYSPRYFILFNFFRRFA